MSATFTSLAYNLTTLRERGILKRLRGTPLPTSAYLAGLAANAIANALLQVVIVIVVGHVAARRLLAGRLGRARASSCARAWSASRCSASRSRTRSRTRSPRPAYVNAVFLPQILIAGVFYDAADAPSIIRDIAQALPLTHLVDGLSGAIVDGEGLGTHWVALLVLGVVGRDRRRPRGARLLVGSTPRLS